MVISDRYYIKDYTLRSILSVIIFSGVFAVSFPVAAGESFRVNETRVSAAPPPGGGGSGPGVTPSSNEFIHFGLNAKDSITPETTYLLGEQIDLNTGALSFAYTDVSIPGNNSIPVSVSRRFRGAYLNFGDKGGFGDWSLDIPHIRTKVIVDSKVVGTWGRGKECSGERDFESGGSGDSIFTQAEYYDGEHIHVPGKVSSQLLFTGGDHPKRTLSNWLVSCKPNTVNTGEMYVVQSPGGLTYTFNEKVRVSERILRNESGATTVYTTYLYVSKIEDRFGNSANYHYASINTGVNTYRILKKISSSDGRVISINHNLASPNNHVITSISANGRTWLYHYEKNNYVIGKTLVRVTRPDNSQWHFDLSPLSFRAKPEKTCALQQGTGVNVSITHPNGVTGIFKIDTVRQGKSNVEKVFNHIKNIYYTKTCHFSRAITSKTITGPGLPTSTWSYHYSAKQGFYAGENSAGTDYRIASPYPSAYINNLDYRTTTVSSPDGSKTMYYHNRDYTSVLDGSLIVTEYYDTDSTSLLKRVVNTYQQGPAMGRALIENVNRKPTIYRALLTKTTVELQRAGVSQQYFTEFSDFNDYGVAQQTKGYNSFSNNVRFTKQNYYHDTTNYLLNLPTSTYVSDNNTFLSSNLTAKQTYHSATGAYKSLPYEHASFGRWTSRNESYYTSGTQAGLLKRTRYNASVNNSENIGNRWLETSNYYRGIPQTVTTPTSMSSLTQSSKRIVDSNGWVKRSIDGKGNITDYTYDSLGRVKLVEPADSKWSNTRISYTSATGGEESSFVSSGMLIKTTSNGNFKSKIYYDGLLRPVLTKNSDNSDSSTVYYTRSTYNVYGKAIFQSFPSQQVATPIGDTIAYDGLGRLSSTRRQSDGATTTVEYLSGNKRSVTDAKGNVATTTYLAYGSPSYAKPTLIEAPNSSDTAIAYNQFGQISSITQGNVTEKRLYDGYQQLCKAYRPETGVTAYGYNAQRQPVWYAEGTQGGSSSCAASSVPASHKILLGYDNLGQIKTENFPDSTPDNTYNYDANGNLASLISGSGSSSISWSYLYNSLNLMEKETLSMDGKSFVLDWDYNSLGAISSLKYPSGRTIHYAPNALGQPTKASEGTLAPSINYASNIKYHANGQLKQLTYGNGIVRNVAVDTTGRIDAISDVKGSLYHLRIDPSYDKNDNLTGLIDWVDRSNDIDNMSYDGLDRLTSADGKWGRGSYRYDGLGNILSRSISGSTINYSYNSLNRLNNITGAYRYNYGYDPRGNVIHNGRYGLDFNRANQVKTAKGIPYRYDGHNRRVKKQADYSVYSQGGQLLYRQEANGNKTDTVYLGRQLIAEIDLNGTYTAPTAKPIINLRTFYAYEGLGAPRCDFGNGRDGYSWCQYISSSSLAMSAWPEPLPGPYPNPNPTGSGNHVIHWDTEHATSCTGTVRKYKDGYLGTAILSGTSSTASGKQYPADGTIYSISLTCTGAGGSTTKRTEISTRPVNSY